MWNRIGRWLSSKPADEHEQPWFGDGDCWADDADEDDLLGDVTASDHGSASESAEMQVSEVELASNVIRFVPREVFEARYRTG